MVTIFYARVVQIKPLPHSEMKKTHPEIVGAFLTCFIPANNLKMAKLRLKTALLEDGYELVNIKEIVDFSKCELTDKKVLKEYSSMAWEAKMKDVVIYAAFYCF